jgi:hypothetical protein
VEKNMLKIATIISKVTLASLLLINSIQAMDTLDANELANAYKGYLGVKATEIILTPSEAFQSLAKEVNGLICGAVTHEHVKEGPSYGRSFTIKNKHALDFVVELLTGKVKSWPKKTICSGEADICIADVGCGIGLGAVYALSEVVKYYEAEGWTIEKPIELDLCDITPEHQGALSALTELVNMAYPQYFKLRTFSHIQV